MRSILINTSEKLAAKTLSKALKEDYSISFVADFDVFSPNNQGNETFDALFIDIDTLLKGVSLKNSFSEIKTAFRKIRKILPGVEVVVMTYQERIRETINLIKAGASSYLTYPIDSVEIQNVMESIQDTKQIQLELDYLRDQFWQIDALELIRTNSPIMQDVFNKVRTVAAKKVTVLLTGETGTGKGVISRLIHQHSKRNSDQFISVHCGAIPDSLLESELFGHEKGAFTGASQQKLGRFEIANNGTIFLDEIGTITPSMQVKLLQVLQDNVIQRIGSEQAIDVDIRIIAATNEDLNQRRLDGTFRGDLFYRLNVFPIEIPPLRQRQEDIALLVETFLSRLNALYGKEINYIHKEVLEAFRLYDWPGNIRELENLMERGYLLEESDTLGPACFPKELFSASNVQTSVALNTDITLADFRKNSYKTLEQQYLGKVLAKHHGSIGKTAQTAGITPRQLNRLMQKHKLRKEIFKN